MLQSQKKGDPLALAVETSGRAGSLAIGIGQEINSWRSFSGPMRHSAELFPAITQLLREVGRECSEIKHVYISAGPGSFTGIRIAVTLAKIMHFANSARIVAVNTMQVIAENAIEYMKDKKLGISTVATILDAKRGQFFVAIFERQKGRWVRSLSDCLMSSEDFVKRFSGSRQPVWLLGEGLVYYAEAFEAEGIHIIEPAYWPADAKKLYKLGWEMAVGEQFADPITLTPFYLREPEAMEKPER
jgi:tRNA threonylcarbamoyladenosine biosynthesis protein TsaB